MQDEIDFLCMDFGFKKEEFFGNTKIISSKGRDYWYVVISLHTIKLYHMNKHGSGGYHHQKDFTDLYGTFKYIKDHDGKYKNPKKYSKFYTILGIIDQLNIQNSIDKKKNVIV